MLKVGDTVKWGDDEWKVSAIGYVGERYYWLIKGGVVSMVPAVDLERKRKSGNVGTHTDKAFTT